jgi:hypothetical protein
MADEQREHRAKKNIYAFLQRRSIEQRRSYLARGRRFLVLDVAQLSKSWITAVNNWLARKDRASEIMMDDLTAEGVWTTVPYDKINNVIAPDGGAHVCAPRQVDANKGVIFCVILPSEG